jgi:tripartite-type tricarboxylate transporter receptor subunit TctC
MLLKIFVASLTLSSMFCGAQTYPQSKITLVVPFAAGSGTDAVARVIALKAGQLLGQPVLVDNRPGASAQIGAQIVASAKPDGYTLLMTTNTSHSANPWLFSKLSYDPIADFTPITRVGELLFVLCVNKELPVKNLTELINYAQAHPQTLFYGTPNSTSLVSTASLLHHARISMTPVAYKSSPQAIVDLVSNQIQVYVADTGSVMGMIQAGKIRPLAMTSSRLYAPLSNVPAMSSTLTNFKLVSWNGIFGPAKMPASVVETLNKAFLQALNDKEVQENMAKHGLIVWPSESPTDFAHYVKEQMAYWGRLIKLYQIPTDQN